MKSVERWSKEAKALVSGGRRLAYWTSGERDETKPWLLLIHGYPTSSWDWTFVWDGLRRHFRLAAMDMLGFGLSDKPRDIAYSIAMQADFQEALLAHLGAGSAHVFTHDYGNTVGQELLARHNEGSLSFVVQSMVFLNGGLFPEQHRARPIQKLGLTPVGFLLGLMLTEEKLRKTFDEIYGPATKASDAEIAAHWAMINAGGGRRVLHKLLSYIPQRRENRARWVGALAAARAPLRLIDGGADPVSGAHLYRYYLEQVPNADAVLFDDIGHYPHTEAPERVLAAFLEFHRKLKTVDA
ncbi:MAG: alpha/beta fold hydrolase [Parvularculaceae bacterium]